MKIAACISIAGAVFFATALAGDAQSIAGAAIDLPLYAAFKAFCVDTGTIPQSVNAAVKAAGGRPSDRPGGSTENGTLPDAPFPMTTSAWTVTIGGHRMLVVSERAWPSRGGWGRANDFDTCSIHSDVNEDVSIAAIQEWVGVPATEVSLPSPTHWFAPELTSYRYAYQAVGGAHMAIIDKESYRRADAEGRHWTLDVMREPQSAGLQLVHQLPSPVREKSK